MAHATMKAIAQTEYGDPEVLKVLELPKPVPEPRDLLIRVRAVSMNPVDCKKRRNFGNTSAPVSGDPVVVGWDGAGVVEAVGSEVNLFKVGDEVYFAGNIRRQGCHAQYVLIDERIVGRKPKSLSFVEAAAVPLTGLTAWEGMIEGMNIPKNTDKTLMVVAGAGGVGSIAIQIAKRVLHVKRVIATASRADSEKFCREMGADDVINHRNDLAAELKKIGLNGVDYILNCTDPDNFDDLVKVLNPLGKICLIVGTNKPLNVGAMMSKRQTLVWELMFTRPLYNAEPEKQGEILNALADLLDSKVLVPRATIHMTIDKIVAAHRLQESGTVIGKIVIPMDL